MEFSKKMMIAAVALICVMAGLSIYSYEVARTGIQDATRNELSSVAGVMATQFDAKELAGLKPGAEFSQDYLAIVKKLRAMRSMDDRITNAYILKVAGQDKITFLVDDLFLDDPAGSGQIGEVYDSPDRMDIFGALSLPTASQKPYTDKWGTFMSGYAPVDDSASGSLGNTTAVLGVDMDAGLYRSRVLAAGVSIMLATLVSMALVIAVLWVATRRQVPGSPGGKAAGPGHWEKD